MCGQHALMLIVLALDSHNHKTLGRVLHREAEFLCLCKQVLLHFLREAGRRGNCEYFL